jgi:hypothetical protein
LVASRFPKEQISVTVFASAAVLDESPFITRVINKLEIA